jgi:hypothetical protein
MKFLRAIMGNSKRNYQKCTYQRRAHTGEYTEIIKRNRLRWYGHIERMDEHRIPKPVLDMKMSGKRARCRPQT